jgi:hypothetical protein
MCVTKGVASSNSVKAEILAGCTGGGDPHTSGEELFIGCTDEA